MIHLEVKMGKYIGFLGSFASIISLFFTKSGHVYLTKIIIVVCFISLSIALFFEIREYLKSRGREDY